MSRRPSVLWCFRKAACAVIAAACMPLTAEDKAAEFRRDIQPILVTHCYECHGPDAALREAGLRLDLREQAMATLPSGGKAIVPGDASASEIVARISSKSADERMPPDEKRPLSDTERDLLIRWIAEGANYEAHWSTVPVRRPTLPATGDASWAQNPIDAFVLNRLNQRNFIPAPRADERTLIRRISLLTRGLPPTPAEVAAAEHDGTAKFIDRMLASPAFGERMAQDWLDAARYADTTGHAADMPRTMWLYRDWVIDAVNRDMPFDQFTVEQLAGDMLPEPTVDQLIATGFHRNSMQALGNNPRKEEFRVKGIVDRLETTGRVWLATSLGCAECHDHKYDPISTREYYQAFAIFNNVPHYGERFEVHGPRLEVQSSATRREIQRVEQRLAQLSKELNAIAADDDFQRRLKQRVDAERTKQRQAPQPKPLLHLMNTDDALRDGAQQFRRTHLAPEIDEDKLTRALTVSTWIKTRSAVADIVSKYDWRAGQRSLVFGIGGEREKEALPGTLYVWLSSKRNPFAGVTVYGSRRIDDGKWHHVAFTFEPGKAVSIFVDGHRDAEAKVAGGVPNVLARNDRALVVGAGYSNSNRPNDFFLDGRLADLRVHAAAITDMRSVGFVPSRESLQAELLHSGPRAKQIASQQRALNERRDRLTQQTVTAQVMDELPQPRVTRIHIRGDYENLGDIVKPGIPASLDWQGSALVSNRLQFARWLVDPRHPLTARVAVNRIWQHYFGSGLVRTADDFGIRGESPTHPQLLDWLAAEFVSSGWSRKHMHRLILNSATFQQSSITTAKRRQADPDNRYLACFPRRRATAEVIRDSILGISGQLERRIGGRSVYPYQPPGVGTFRDGTAGQWKDDSAPQRYRRGIYVFWQRMSPYPSMTLFDATSRERCTIKRSVTNTPLQALAMLNDPVFVEAARSFANRVSRTADSPDERMNRMFELALCRLPTAEENQRFLAFHKQFADDPQDAWFHIATVLLNLDETISIE